MTDVSVQCQECFIETFLIPRNLWRSLMTPMQQILGSTKTSVVQQQTLVVRCVHYSAQYKVVWFKSSFIFKCKIGVMLSLISLFNFIYILKTLLYEFACIFAFRFAYVFTLWLQMWFYSRWQWQGWWGLEPSPSHTCSSQGAPHHEPPGIPQGAGKRQLWQGRPNGLHL